MCDQYFWIFNAQYFAHGMTLFRTRQTRTQVSDLTRITPRQNSQKGLSSRSDIWLKTLSPFSLSTQQVVSKLLDWRWNGKEAMSYISYIKLSLPQANPLGIIFIEVSVVLHLLRYNTKRLRQRKKAKRKKTNTLWNS